MVGGRNISLLPTTLHPAKVKESADNSSDRGDSGNEERRVGECAWIAAVNRDSQFAVLLIVVFVDLFSVGMVVPLIPYIADELGADATLYGLLGSFYGVFQIMGSPLMGYLSDIHSRKLVLCISFLSAMVSYGLVGVAPSLVWLLLSRVPVGICKQTITVARTIVSDITEESERSKRFGYLSAVADCGFILGPTAGGYLVSCSSYLLPCFLATCLYFLNIIFVCLFLEESHPRGRKLSHSKFRQVLVEMVEEEGPARGRETEDNEKMTARTKKNGAEGSLVGGRVEGQTQVFAQDIGLPSSNLSSTQSPNALQACSSSSSPPSQTSTSTASMPSPSSSSSSSSSFSLFSSSSSSSVPSLQPLTVQWLYILFFTFYAEMLLTEFLPKYLQMKYEISPQENGLLQSFAMSLSVLSQTFGVYFLGAQVRERKVLSGAMLLLSLSLCGLSVSSSLPIFLFFWTPFSIASAVENTYMIGKITTCEPADHMGRAIGMSGMMDSIARALAPISAGILSQNVGVDVPVTLAATICMACAIYMEGYLFKGSQKNG